MLQSFNSGEIRSKTIYNETIKFYSKRKFKFTTFLLIEYKEGLIRT